MTLAILVVLKFVLMHFSKTAEMAPKATETPGATGIFATWSTWRLIGDNEQDKLEAHPEYRRTSVGVRQPEG